MGTITQHVTMVTTKQKHTFTPGGFSGYWNLFGKMLKTARNFPLKSSRKKMLAMLWASSPWYLLIKPFGQFFPTVTRYAGKYKTVNGQFYNVSTVKTKTYKAFGIPVFYTRTEKLSANDIKKIRE